MGVTSRRCPFELAFGEKILVPFLVVDTHVSDFFGGETLFARRPWAAITTWKRFVS